MAPEENSTNQNTTSTDGRDGGPSMNWGGRLALGLIFAAGVAVLIYLGLILGMFVGLDRGAEVMENTPHQNTGLAPDLTGLVNGTFAFAKSAIVGAGIGLIAGLAAMGAVCRYLLAPLFRRTSLFTTQPI